MLCDGQSGVSGSQQNTVAVFSQTIDVDGELF